MQRRKQDVVVEPYAPAPLGRHPSNNNNNNNSKIGAKSSSSLSITRIAIILVPVALIGFVLMTSLHLLPSKAGSFDTTNRNNNKSNNRMRRPLPAGQSETDQIPAAAPNVGPILPRGLDEEDAQESVNGGGLKGHLQVPKERHDQEDEEQQEDSNYEGLTHHHHHGGLDSQHAQYHLIFSTGCSTYQDWQSYLFFFQILQSGQPGMVTRIASGCDEADHVTLQAVFDQEISPMAPERFKIHFTPDYSRIKNGRDPFVYFNKPFGVRHWLEHAMGFPNDPVDEDVIVILLDPDQLILRPFTNNDFSNTVWKFLGKDETPRTHIAHGLPMGQLYGFALQWKDKVDMTKLILPNVTSPVDLMSRDDARRGYIVGPPYIATARDMYQIAVKWTEFAVPVHDQYPFLLAEMFAYCLAAAHLQLSHQTATSFMVSDVTSGQGEGWSYVDAMTAENVCQDHPVAEYPNVLHFCQRYGLGQYFWGKRRLPKNFLSCESPLFPEPPTDLALKHTDASFPDGHHHQWDDVKAKRNAFMLCHLIPIANAAATYYKQQHCEAGMANFDKSLVLH